MVKPLFYFYIHSPTYLDLQSVNQIISELYMSIYLLTRIRDMTWRDSIVFIWLVGNAYVRNELMPEIFVFSHCLCPWMDFGLLPRWQKVWCHLAEIEPFSAMLAQDGLAERDQPGTDFLEILSNGRELNASHEEDRQWDKFILPLGYHDWFARDRDEYVYMGTVGSDLHTCDPTYLFRYN